MRSETISSTVLSTHSFGQACISKLKYQCVLIRDTTDSSPGSLPGFRWVYIHAYIHAWARVDESDVGMMLFYRNSAALSENNFNTYSIA